MCLLQEKSEVTAIELFAGAGGLALGLEQAGIKTKAYIESDKNCCQTLSLNRPEWNVICSDVRQLSFSTYHDVDLVAGGFPCQAFSSAGKKLGFEDTRGTLFYEFARCVKEIKPKMLLAENVKGLISHDNGNTFFIIKNILEEMGYKLEYKILNAAYYGVGQKRERVIIVGIRNDVNMTFRFPTADTNVTTLREALKNCPKSVGAKYSDMKKKVLDLVPPGGCWTSLPEDIKAAYCGKSISKYGGSRGVARRMQWDMPSLTLTCSPSQKMTERCHPDETRPFTIREYARIQSFPDEWNFCGSIAAQYKQIGNAVPVELARRIGVQIIKSFTAR